MLYPFELPVQLRESDCATRQSSMQPPPAAPAEMERRSKKFGAAVWQEEIPRLAALTGGSLGMTSKK